MSKPVRFAAAFAATTLAVAAMAMPAGATKPAPPPTDPGPTVVATGLLNPRGLDFAPNGTLYVAEAGAGGATEIAPGTFVGLTSRISAVNVRGSLPTTASPVVTGLVSVSGPGGAEATGADGLSLQGGRILTIMTGAPQLVGDAPSSPLVDTARAQLGHLIQGNPGGQSRAIADVGGTDFTYTQSCLTATPACEPNTDFPDANPYGVLAVPGGTYVVDAGANTLDFVGANGSVKILAYFNFPGPTFTGLNDEVPTCLAQAGGKLYIGSLNGRVWRYDGGSTLTEVPITTPPGPPLVSIGGCTSDGTNLYVSDQFGGAVWKIAPGGAATMVASVNDPSGIVFGPDGYLYVSADSTSTNGEVVRIAP